MDNLQVSYSKYQPEEKSSEDNSYLFDKEVNGFQFATIKKSKVDHNQTYKKRTLNQSIRAQPASKLSDLSTSNKPEILVSRAAEQEKVASWDPVASVNIVQQSVNIVQPNNNKMRETLKQETFGWEPENSIALDPTGKKLLGEHKAQIHSENNNDDKNLAKTQTLGWNPDESVAVNAFGIVANNKRISVVKTFEKTDTLGWKPEESVCVNEFGKKDENKGWVPEESVVVNGNGNRELSSKFKSTISIGSPNFPALTNLKKVEEKDEDQSKNEFPIMDSVQCKNRRESKEEKKSGGGWDAIQSIDVNKREKERNSVKNNDDYKNEDVFDSVPVNQGKNSKTQNSNYTLPETFFSKKMNSLGKNHNFDKCCRISLLAESLNIMLDSFKLLYNKETVVKGSRLQEDVKMRLKMPSMSPNIHIKKIIPSHKEKFEEKGEKGQKGGKISKIMKIKDRVCIQIHDIKENLSRTVYLGGNLNGTPSKFHCWDQYNGYFYVYDNNGKIFVYIGNIKDDWGTEVQDASRKISELKLPYVIIDPILYLIKISKDESVLLVIGGSKENKENKFAPVDRIFVFYVRFSGGYAGSVNPLFQIKMRYGRIRPLVCKQRCANEKYLLIIGGNNTKKIKREHILVMDDYDNFQNSLKMGESITIKTIKDTVFQCRMRSIKEIGMENSLKIESLNKNILRKMYTFSQGAVIRIKTGNVGEREGKTNFFIGVGISKRSVYYLDYLDYTHSCLSINKAFTKFVALGVISSEMVFFRNKTLYYLVDDNNEKNYKTQIIDFGEEKHHKTTKCMIF